jgi:hypothetical protein
MLIPVILQLVRCGIEVRKGHATQRLSDFLPNPYTERTTLLEYLLFLLTLEPRLVQQHVHGQSTKESPVKLTIVYRLPLHSVLSAPIRPRPHRLSFTAKRNVCALHAWNRDSSASSSGFPEPPSRNANERTKLSSSTNERTRLQSEEETRGGPPDGQNGGRAVNTQAKTSASSCSQPGSRHTTPYCEVRIWSQK